MMITCPSCQAKYKIDLSASSVLFVCSSCDHEFQVDMKPRPVIEETDESKIMDIPLVETIEVETVEEEAVEVEPVDHHKLPTDNPEAPAEKADPEINDATIELNITKPISDQENTLIDEVKHDVQESGPSAPQRKKQRIWPWLSLILLLGIATGLWYQQDVWVNHPLVRSALLKTGLSKVAYGTDWFIDDRDVQMYWRTGPEDKLLLIVEGTIENTLMLPLPLPRFAIRFSAQNESPLILSSFDKNYLDIAIDHGGESKAEWLDHTLVAPQESRLFTLILQQSLDRPQRISIVAFPGEEH